jgi:WD40 repeat protein
MAHPEPGDVSPIWRTPTSSARPIVVSGGDDATVRVWDLESGELLHQPLTGHDGDVNALALGELHGRAIVASGGNDRTVRLWDLVSGESLGAALQGHRRKVRAVAIGEFRDRPIVVSGSNDNTVRVWDLDSGRLLYEPLVGHHGNVTAIAVGELRGCAIAVSGSEDFTLRVWDLEVGRPLGTLQGHEGFVHTVALGELGGRPIAVSGGDDKTVRVWALDTGGPLGRPLRGHREWVTAVAVGALGGRQIAVSGGIDQTVRVWDLEKAGPLGEPLVGHEGWVNAVAVGTIGDRSIAVSGGDDNTVRTWDLSAGGPLGWPLRHYQGVNAVAVGELQGGPPPASGETHRDTDEPAAWRVATDRRRDEETAPKPGVADPRTSPESVMAGASTSSMPSPKRGPSMRPGVSMRTLRGLLKAHWGKITCLLLGVGLVVGGVSYLTGEQSFAATAAHADGIVVGHRVSTSTSQHRTTVTYCPVVRFRTAHEQPIQFTSGECTSSAPEVGAPVKVLYDPDNPRHAELDATWARLVRWGFGGAITVVGLLFAAGSIFAIARAVWRKIGRRRGDGVRDDLRPRATDTAGDL